MKKLGELYQLVNLLSLDVAAGAVVSAMFFARILGVAIFPPGLAALGLTVWIIYTADHLADARRLKTAASSRRHRFHQRHFRILAGILPGAILLDCILVFFLRQPVLYSGGILSAMVVVYFLVQQNLRYVKEFFGAALYSLGVLVPAWSLSTDSISLSQGIFILEFCITALCNMLLFSLFDFNVDLTDNHPSFATTMGSRKTGIILTSLFILNGGLMMTHFLWTINVAGGLLSLLSMNLILVVIFIYREQFEANDRYRLLGDAIFLIPLLLVAG